MVFALVVGALWAMLPAYVPNNAAVLAGGGRPIDAGRTWKGKRLLGDGKTWRGTAAGTLAGAALSQLQNAAHDALTASLGAPLPTFPLAVGVALAFGAMAGDVAASFLKRRLGRERGAAVPGLDQLDFVVGALALAALADPAWTREAFPPAAIGVVVVATPLLHLLTNAVAYLLGLKDEPW